jgi:hypothetical protein
MTWIEVVVIEPSKATRGPMKIKIESYRKTRNNGQKRTSIDEPQLEQQREKEKAKTNVQDTENRQAQGSQIS